MPQLTGILETCLYVDDLNRATRFYQSVFEFPLLVGDERIRALEVADKQLLLLFQRGGSLARATPHDGSGPVHLAFAVPAAELPAWEERLSDHGVSIEDVTNWERGGRSLYFRDPDGHLLELATPGVWAIY
jgi:catechol 2,3-dioxygenase-like lactoylglutathione lyase family enzyme